MFDPFKDFETAGYLRNKAAEKNQSIVKRVEHELFTLNFSKAVDYLANKKILSYGDFQVVHRTLFKEFYPWAGQDRNATSPDLAISKAGIYFAQPWQIRDWMEKALKMAQDKEMMVTRPGEIMGMFAYGHPFLDGNGRTMLLVHMELCYRAGISVGWSRTDKNDYLKALSDEIAEPAQGILDRYLKQFEGQRMEHSAWGREVSGMKGLDGLDGESQSQGSLDDPVVMERYRKFELARQYSYEERAAPACTACGATPCACRKAGPSGPKL